MAMETGIKILQAKARLSLKDLQSSNIWQELEHYATLLEISNARQILHHAANDLITVPSCPVCNTNKLKWHQDRKSYTPYCGNRCAGIGSSALAKKTSLEKYGVEHYSQTKEFNQRVQTTNLEKYGVEHYSQTKECQEKKSKTVLEKYGVDNILKSAAVKEKIKKTNLEKYGVENPLKNKSIRDKSKVTLLERYGVDNPTKSDDIKEKIKKTNLERYQTSNPGQNKDIAKKRGQSKKENYYSKQVLERLEDREWLEQQNQSTTVGEIALTLGVSHSNLCKYFQKHNIDIKYHQTTSLERRLEQYFIGRGVRVEVKNRKIITPKEIDIFFPDFNFGIEINGGYWHSSEFNKDPKAQLKKIQMAAQQCVKLIHFWDWELNNNWSLVISKIEHQLGLSKKLYARRLSIRSVDTDVKDQFLNENHLQGTCASKINIGLYDQNQLVMLGTFGKSRFSKKAQWELLRLASCQNTAVVGGADKIFKNFVSNYVKTGEKIISYCQKRLGKGAVYSRMGFKESHSTEPGYVYVKRGLPAGSRNQWQKHMLAKKLDIFDPLLSESENMAINGYYKAWDCGQIVFEFVI